MGSRWSAPRRGRKGETKPWWCPMRRISGGIGLEDHRNAVHAIAQPSRLRSVVENMSEMPAALTTMDRGPGHAERLVLDRADGTVKRGPKARPNQAAYQLGLRGEQRQVTPCARKSSCPLFVIERACERPLGSLLPQHRILV